MARAQEEEVVAEASLVYQAKTRSGEYSETVSHELTN